MGTKRNKKAKQEQVEMYLQDNDGRVRTESLSEADADVDMENNTVQKTSKKNKKREEHEVPKKSKRNSESSDTEPKKKKKKKNFENVDEPAIAPAEVDSDHKEEIISGPDKRYEEIDWPEEDLTILLNRMEQHIPEQDALLYTTRAERLDWAKIAFKGYTVEECRNTWYLLSKKLRRFRVLSEVIADAKDWVMHPKVAQKAPARPKKHPDMPRRPLTSYLLFYLKKKDKIMSENPGLEGTDITKLIGQTYKKLPPEKKEKYEKMAESNKEEYVEKLRVFFEKHPELLPASKNHTAKSNDRDKEVQKVEKALKPAKDKPVKVEKADKREKPTKLGRSTKTAAKIAKPEKDRPPKQNQTAFGLYFQTEFKNNPGAEKGAFRDKCKEQWKQLSDRKKLAWIIMAEEDLARYEAQVAEYKAKHPEYDANKAKAAITKYEKSLKERLAGKPIKPPNSAYGLYSKIMLQSEEIKVIHPKDRMNFIANKWKNTTEDERNKFKDQALNLMEKYKTDYSTYLESLPEDQRRLEEQVISKRKNNGRKPKVAKKDPPAKFKEPEQPPISPSKYFATVYNGNGDPVKAWKSLSSDEKRKYEEELTKKKQAYIVEFERFLKSLTIEELEAFRKSRQLQSKSDDEGSTCSSDSEDDDDDDEGEDDGDDNDESDSE